MPSRLSLNDAHSIAKHYGGKCLSKDYINNSTPLKWMCKKGHTWDNTFDMIQRGGWCKQCNKNNQWLERLQIIAKNKGGKCLSEKYINSGTKLRFQCANGHVFLLRPQNLKQNDSWCIVCYRAEEKEKAFNKLKTIALKKGGKCLSKHYHSKKTSLKWRCRKGHTWTAQPRNITVGKWCAICKRNEKCDKELEKLQSIAVKKGGKCLSKTYFRKDSYLKWKCKKRAYLVCRTG